ncbi:PAS domain-containing sensor histidine kinase [Nostoc sp. 'Peltigera membranacea cyanobiont' 210A]|uniref:PAS domain-containing sensor histidine kinase n=1 Tax=Nostoc sp. 'Peltigera membranacea cyanobiont' 210A TaxID=2014529 RepID=UPI000B95BAF3|nr:ATP-binding protein [Nostoc sp. 'Peltigera membranacea cyanobiont' 210A]OYD91280.1 PAS domain-containing sensor histidine kinase [Nostoc sp. 'Peltigera membranacea cyanobiont' 210A]
MATPFTTVQSWWRKTFSAPTTDEITSLYRAWRNRFLWQRLRLWLWLALICLLSFTLRDIYGLFFPFAELQQLPEVLRTQRLVINVAMLATLIICFALHKTKLGRHRPDLLFLGSSWSISLASQLFATIRGFALPDTIGWSLLFLSQAVLMPVCWILHLLTQVSVLIYYFGVNTTLGLKTPIPDHPEIYNVTFILYIFWFCTICDIGVYLYDRLQRSEFFARQELESAYQKLKVAEAKYRSIFENAVEGIFQSSPDGHYITANPALARIYGYSVAQEVTANFTDIEQLYVDPNRRAEFVRLMEKYGSVSDFESQIYRQDGSIVWISEKAYAVRDEHLKLLYYEGLIEDITQRKQTEEELRVFFHAVSHDLRNPVLGTLMVLKNLLARSEENIAISRSILERMIQSSDRQLNLINSLMETHISEVQGVVLQRQTVQLLTVVEAAIADLEPLLAQNQAKLTNLVSADLPLVNADPTQLWRVFSNLIVNALKHNPPGLLLTINATREGEMIYCTVSDNGVGISQQQSDRLFDLYFRGASIRNSVSLGLGLYLCKQIINAHGGEIGVNSALDEGANFWFTLPVI